MANIWNFLLLILIYLDYTNYNEINICFCHDQKHANYKIWDKYNHDLSTGQHKRIWKYKWLWLEILKASVPVILCIMILK